MPELKHQPQFVPSKVFISRDSRTYLTTTESISFDEQSGILKIFLDLSKESQKLKEAIETSSPFSPWTFTLEFLPKFNRIHGSDLQQFKVVSLLCKTGKLCGLVKKYGRILRSPDVLVNIEQNVHDVSSKETCSISVWHSRVQWHFLRWIPWSNKWTSSWT